MGGQEKVAKEKATPLGACRAMPGKSVSRGRAFRPDSCPDEKASTSMSMPASRPDRPRLTAAQGSEERPLSPALSPAKRGRGSQELPRRELFAVAQPLRTECAPRWRAPLRGPLCSGGRAEEKPAGWPAWMPASLSSAQDVLSTNPVARTRTLRTGCPQGAEAGWPSLWLLSLGHPRESSSRSAGVRKLLPWLFKSIAAEAVPTKSKSTAHDRRKSLVDRVRSYKKEQKHRARPKEVPGGQGPVRCRRGMLRKAMLHGTSRKWLMEEPLVGDLAAMANAKMWPVQVISSLRWRDGGLTMP